MSRGDSLILRSELKRFTICPTGRELKYSSGALQVSDRIASGTKCAREQPFYLPFVQVTANDWMGIQICVEDADTECEEEAKLDASVAAEERAIHVAR